jgi:hypothetical protein
MEGGPERSRTRIATLARRVVLAACFLGTASAALTQGLPPPKDTIFARKILMGSIDMNMDEIETMTAPDGTLNLGEGQEHADIVSIMLMSFPHMFPPGTNQWVANADRDPATDTFASPDVWSNFADFYQRAQAASKIAFDASRAKRPDDFKALVVQLRAACNGCHATYMKTD